MFSVGENERRHRFSNDFLKLMQYLIISKILTKNGKLLYTNMVFFFIFSFFIFVILN